MREPSPARLLVCLFLLFTTYLCVIANNSLCLDPGWIVKVIVPILIVPILSVFLSCSSDSTITILIFQGPRLYLQSEVRYFDKFYMLATKIPQILSLSADFWVKWRHDNIDRPHVPISTITCINEIFIFRAWVNQLCGIEVTLLCE